jgi:2-aminoethylphosphonate dioxygenase
VAASTPDDLVARSVLTPADLDGWAREIEAWPAGSHLWGHYAEATDRGPAICRTENVSVCHPGVAGVVAGQLAALAAERLGQPATAFKDKINYKQPGGAGFLPHQDQVAYPNARNVVSLLVAIDECTTDNGCLWVAAGVDRVLDTDERGVVRADLSRELQWQPVELAPGDVLCIDGLAPHWSDTNRTERARRVMVASYSPAADRYTRAAYYAARGEVMAARTDSDGRFRISTLADFAGDEVRPETVATEQCTHP